MFKIWSYFSFTDVGTRHLRRPMRLVSTQERAKENQWFPTKIIIIVPCWSYPSASSSVDSCFFVPVTMDYDSLIYSHIANYYDELVSFKIFWMSTNCRIHKQFILSHICKFLKDRISSYEFYLLTIYSYNI